MAKRHWRLIFSGVLLGSSVLLYFLHFLIFRDAKNIFYYLLGNIAFVPISVLLVTLVLENILEAKQKELIAHKLNMVVGAFFSEVGQSFLRFLQDCAFDNPLIIGHLRIGNGWTSKDFLAAKKSILNLELSVDLAKVNLVELKNFLNQKRSFLLMLLENPNLLEHEKITDMLWAICHLTEELDARKNLFNLSEKDRDHLATDTKRAYGQLILSWVEYMKHLKADYPYLFSLAVRMNPFDPHACAEIK